jgi:glycosyltransferase involved in cell wall biosynthesis
VQPPVDVDPIAPDILPAISVVIEGYNESHEQGTLDETLAALARQTYPLHRVSVVAVGSSDQVAAWQPAFAGGHPFASIRAYAADGAHYYALKNRGAEGVEDAIIAFTDSDVKPDPGWLAGVAAALRTADVAIGISRFQGSDAGGLGAALRQAASAVTYGWIVGRAPGGALIPDGFLAHNVAFRAEAFRAHSYLTEHGRTCGSMLLYSRIKQAGLRIVLQPRQQAAHYFTWSWWLRTFHYRAGYEVFRVRRLDDSYPHRWIARTGVLEPVVTMIWHTAFDLRQWPGYSRAIGLSPARRLLLWPVLLGLSVAAHAAEMAGMYATIASPERMRQWAESS